MKFVQSILMVLLVSTTIIFAYGSNDPAMAEEDSVNLLAEYSLFHEYHKNKDFESAYPHGWTVININPKQFVKYRVFKKMEEILWYMHDSLETTEEEKAAITDTTLFLYQKAIEYEPKKAGTYLVKDAYVRENWMEAETEEVVSAYEKALNTDPTISSFYKDRLGIIYSQNATEENGYKMKALELYSNLSEGEPDNATWIARIESLADNIDELVDITKKSWDLDRDNLEKAWKYASICVRAQELEKSIEPLEFLIEKSPEVISYHKQIASSYEKIGETDRAVNSYKTLITLEPDNKDNYINIALVYKKLNQLSVARSYLQKASSSNPDWDYPIYIEAQLYEQSGRNCVGAEFEFMDKCVYKLAVDTYAKAARMGGNYGVPSKERKNVLSNSIPSKEDYFFRRLKSGDTIKIEGNCYGWIGKSITVP